MLSRGADSTAGVWGHCDALLEVNLFKSWSELHDAFKGFPGCDDGSFAETYSDSVVKLLANEWDQLPKLKELAKRDPSFRRFVLSHIDATTDFDELVRVVSAAGERCPPGERTLCGEIHVAAGRAMIQVGRTW